MDMYGGGYSRESTSNGSPFFEKLTVSVRGHGQRLPWIQQSSRLVRSVIGLLCLIGKGRV